MSLITRMRRQTAVWWATPVADGLGNWTFSTAVEVSCRWEDRQELFTDAQGKETVSRAQVYVDRDMKPGEYLMLTSLTLLPSNHTDPRNISGAYEIKAFGKVPNLKASEFLRTATL